MFIGSNEALRQRKGSDLYPKQVRKQLPRPFYIILRSEEASKKRTNQGLVLMVMNSDELEGPNVDLRGRKKGDLRMQGCSGGSSRFSGQTRLM